MATIEQFIVKVVTQGTEQLDKLGKSTDALNSKINKLAAGILGVSFGSFILGALDAADRISDLSDATGISIVNLKSFETALETSGGKARNVERSILGFAQSIETANDGSLKVRDAFAAVGVSLDMLKNASEQDILNKTIEGLKTMKEEGKSASEVSSTAATVLTKAFRGVDVSKFFADFEAGKITLDGVASKIQQQADMNAKLEATYRTLQLGAAEAMSPIIKLFGDGNLTVETATKLVTAFGIALGITFGVQALSGIIALNTALLGTAAAASLLGKNPLIKLGVGLALLGLEAAGAWTAYEMSLSSSDDAAKKLAKSNEELKKSTETPASAGNANRTQLDDPRQKAMIESAKRMRQSQADAEKTSQMSLTDEIKNIRLQSESDILKAKEEIDAKEYVTKTQKAAEFEAKRVEIATKAEYDIAKVRADIERGLREQLTTISRTTEERQAAFDLEQRFNGLGGSRLSLGNQLLDIEKRRKDAIEAATKATLKDPGQLAAQVDAINKQFELEGQIAQQRAEWSRDFSTGWEKAFGDYVDNATNAATIAASMFQSMTNTMNNALDKFVETGKFNFSDLANSILKDILKIQLRASVANLIGGVGGAAGGTGILGAIGGLFRANGGPVSAGSPYIVGERGPELMIPTSAGTVIPNNQLGSGASGANYVTYNINAVDAGSFKQMLARDPSFLYAVSEQGRKTIPQTRR